MDLRLDADALNSCVQCGLCLPHCPTFRVTGDETRSPRGRIQLMREVQDGGAPVTVEVREAFETCVQCRACEPACPSSVPYGQLMEQTRETLIDHDPATPRWRRRMNRRWKGLLFRPLEWPRVLRATSSVGAVAQRARLVPRRLGLPASLPIRRTPHSTSGRDVYLFTGCVMDAWQRDVHLAGQRVIEAAGYGVTPTGDAAPCCGALHAHAGLTDRTRRLADTMIAALSEDTRPILVDSAGCGAAMKDYGRLLGTPEAEAFSARVHDIQEWLADHMDRLPAPATDGPAPLDLTVAIQDPCHLRHVQRVHPATRTVLAPYVRNLVELDDDGLCCGAGGLFSVLQPELAGAIRDRKVAAIERTTPDVVASANPGCAMHLAAAGVPTRHPMELLAEALDIVGPGEGRDAAGV